MTREYRSDLGLFYPFGARAERRERACSMRLHAQTSEFRADFLGLFVFSSTMIHIDHAAASPNVITNHLR